MKLWYENKATEWVQALPIGNGHIGAMAFGGEEGKFELSETTCWSGAAQESYLDPNAKEYMKNAKKLLMEKHVEEAEELMKKCIGIKQNYGTQLPMGRLFTGFNCCALSQTRSLDLMSGVCLDNLVFNDCVVKRESFISNPAKIMCVKLSTEKGKLPQTNLWLEGWTNPTKTEFTNDTITVTGIALENIHSDGLHGVSYTIQLIYKTDGIMTPSKNKLLIDEATYVEVFLTAATSMFFPNTLKCCIETINNGKSYNELLKEHIIEHEGFMKKCEFILPENQFSQLPTNERLLKYREDKTDFNLIGLFFQYGRYLLLNSSRPDSLLPAALQGIWNDNRACTMAWTDDFHLDINTQMNYYPAEVTGLSECTMPLYKWIKNTLMPNGENIAKDLYDSNGWVAHTISNAYGWAAPGWHYSWGFNITGGAWAALHIWEHYLYTKDVDFLKEYFNVLYGAGEFLLSLLENDPSTGELVINPSYSPENSYYLNGKACNITVGSTIDMAVTKCIFNAIINGAQILNIDNELIEKIKITAEKLVIFKIGKYGQLQEWHEDFDETTIDHRHTSHLLSLHPFNLINPQKDKELKAAALISLKRRLGENAQDIVLANWAGALLIMHYARLQDGESAGNFTYPMMSFLSRENMMITHEGPTNSVTGGIYELDGNTGFTAAIAEMLLQSYSGEINILPAIPQKWNVGQYKGLVAYNGHIVDVDWNNSRVNVCILPNSDENITVRFKQQLKTINAQQGKQQQVYFDI